MYTIQNNTKQVKNNQFSNIKFVPLFFRMQEKRMKKMKFNGLCSLHPSFQTNLKHVNVKRGIDLQILFHRGSGEESLSKPPIEDELRINTDWNIVT